MKHKDNKRSAHVSLKKISALDHCQRPEGHHYLHQIQLIVNNLINIFIGAGRLIEIPGRTDGMDDALVIEAFLFVGQIKLPLGLFAAHFAAGPM